jgi:threonine dehydrogenase-like Zn-dependent dehydrogenase
MGRHAARHDDRVDRAGAGARPARARHRGRREGGRGAHGHRHRPESRPAQAVLALALGADHVIDVESEDLVPRVRAITGGAMADIVVDVTANATQPVVDAIDAVRPGGTIVLAGLKGTAVLSFPSDKLVLRGITVIGARGVTAPAYRDAIDLLAADRLPLDRLRTHVFPLAEAERAIQTLAGEVLGEHAINVVIAP